MLAHGLSHNDNSYVSCSQWHQEVAARTEGDRVRLLATTTCWLLSIDSGAEPLTVFVRSRTQRRLKVRRYDVTKECSQVRGPLASEDFLEPHLSLYPTNRGRAYAGGAVLGQMKFLDASIGAVRLNFN